MTAHSAEVQAGQRFAFGKHWQRFLDSLTPERIAEAEASFKQTLDVVTLSGKRFLDIGSGSGLFGNVLKAIVNAADAVAPGGHFVISIYNDQGSWSRRWKRLKCIYNALPAPLRLPYTIVVMGARECPAIMSSLVKLRPMQYVRTYTSYYKRRGMSRWHDMVDWIGGYPFEAAKPEEVFDFFRARGFELLRMKTCAGGLGWNEFVFRLADLPELPMAARADPSVDRA